MFWQTIKNAFQRRIGYRAYKVGKGTTYTLCPPYRYSTYSPWFEDEFLEFYDKIKHHTLVKEDRCYTIDRFCRHCRAIDGDFAECGVFRGGTAFLIAHAMQNNVAQTRRKQLHLFDTFIGMPSLADGDPSGHRVGDFGDSSLRRVQDYLQAFPRVEYHPGCIPETFNAVRERKFCFVHIDVDLYQTTKDCCHFFYDRMSRGGVMIFDDYGFPSYQFAAKKAVDEFFSDKPERSISLHTGQCLVMKI